MPTPGVGIEKIKPIAARFNEDPIVIIPIYFFRGLW